MRLVPLACTAAILCAASAATAQIAPPPPDTRDWRPLEYIPPPPPPEPAVRMRQQPAEGRRPAPRGGRAAPPPVPMPDVPYKPLAEIDEAGSYTPVNGLLPFAAMRHNPFIGPETLERIRADVHEWVDDLDMMVINNIDLAVDVDRGFFEDVDLINNQDQLPVVNEMLQALGRFGDVADVLVSKGKFTDLQRDLNRRLVAEYHSVVSQSMMTAVEREFRARIEANEGQARPLTAEEEGQVRQQALLKGSPYMFRAMCHHALWSYRRQLAEAAPNLDRILPELGLNDEQQQAADRATRALDADADARHKAMTDLMKALEFDQQQQLLLISRELRGELELPQLEEVVNKPEGTPTREDLADWKPGDPVPDAN